MKLNRWTAMAVALILLLGMLPAPALAARVLPEDCPHRWSLRSETPATCTKAGEKVWYCSLCDSTRTEAIKKIPHDYGSWKTTKEPTCTRAGERVRKCKVCRHEDKKKLDRLPHDYGEWTVVKEATCTETGSRTRACRDCGHVDTQTIKTVPHTWGEWTVVVEATDHSPGRRTRTCAVCGATEEEEFDPEGTLRRRAKGDEVRRLQEGLICYGALKGRADGSFGPATERAVKAVQEAEGLTADGVAWPQLQSLIGHKFGEWQTVSKLTRTADGVRERVCARCGLVERDVVEAKPRFKRGDRGKAVEYLQFILEDMGYKPGRRDGVFGPKLDHAVGEWSRDHGWYYEPGLIKPIDIDRIVGDWTSNGDPVGECDEDSPVKLSLKLTPATDLNNVSVGQTVKFYWTATNYGTEDCTLGPVMYSFGAGNTTENVHRQFGFAGDIDGNLLKAEAANNLTGSLSFTADHDLFEWLDTGVGWLYLNAWALGTSRETGKKWRSPTETQRICNDTSTDLVLSVELLSPKKDAYAVDEELAFRWTLTNRGTQPCTLNHVGVSTPADQGMTVYQEKDELPANGGSVSDTCTVKLYDDWRYDGYQQAYCGQWWIYFDAWAKRDGVSIRSNDVDFHLSGEEEASDLVLAVEQTSPKKAAYAVGDEVTFKWTLANRGAEDMRLDYVGVKTTPDDDRDAQSDEFFTEPLILPANGEVSASGTYTITLDANWMYRGWHAGYDGGWRLCFYAYAFPIRPDAQWVRSNDVRHFLPPRAAGSDLLLTVAQNTPEKDGYAIGEEVAYSWTLTNLGTKDLTLDFVGMDWGDDGLRTVHDGPARLRANGANTLTGVWTCALEADMIIDGAWRFEFFARGYEDEMAGMEQYVVSNPVRFEYTPAAIKPNSLPAGLGKSSINLKNGPVPPLPQPVARSLVIVEQTKAESAYYDGAEIPVRMRLTIDSFDTYRCEGITFAPGDRVDDTDWTAGTLEPGQSYEFTYTMVLDPAKTGWKTRNVEVQLVSESTGRAESEACEVRPPFTPAKVTLEPVGGNDHVIGDNAAYLYLTVDKGSYVGEAYAQGKMDLPISVDSDGNTQIRNIVLMCEQKMMGVTYNTQGTKLKDKMDAGDSFDANCQIKAVKTVPDYPDGYSLVLHLTGEITNRKGKTEKVESLPVTLDYNVKSRDGRVAKLELAYSVKPFKVYYLPDDEVTIEMAVRNTGSVVIEDVCIEPAGASKDDAAIRGGISDVSGGARIEPGDEGSATCTYSITPDDVKRGYFQIELIAKGATEGDGKAVQSLRQTIKQTIYKKPVAESLSLSASVIAPESSYAAGEAVPCVLTLTNNAEQKIDALSVLAVGGNRYENSGWRNLGHGLKGWECYRGEYVWLEPGESTEISVSATVPDGYDGATFQPCWVADAQLYDGTPARSNLASVAIATEAAGEGAPTEELILEVEQLTEQTDPEGWHDGDKVRFKVYASYLGPQVPAVIEIMGGRENSSLPLVYEKVEDAWEFSDECEITLDADHAANGVCSCIFSAAAYQSLEGGKEWTATPVAFEFPMVQSKHHLDLEVEQLTEASGAPDGWWMNGDEVLVRVSASYSGPATPYRIEIVATDAVVSEVPLKTTSIENASALLDEFTIQLDAGHAVNDKYVVDFVAYACVEQPDVFDCNSETVPLIFEMAPAAGGPDDMPDGEPGKPGTQINWDAIHAAEAAIKAAEGDSDGSSVDSDASDGAGDVPAARQQAVSLWTDALNAGYDELLAKDGVAAEIIESDRALFFEQLDALRAAVDAKEADELIASQLMRQTMALCEMANTAPERPAGLSAQSEAGSPAAGERCLTEYVETEDGAICREILCERHRSTDSMARARLREGDAEKAWADARRLWLAELDAITLESYQAAGADAAPAVMAARTAYGRWLDAREALLKRLYPEQSEIAQEILLREIRARAIELCSEVTLPRG